MECSFLGINKQKCVYQLRCEGIYQLVLELGGKEEFAKKFSRYTWMRSFLNKISDKSTDPARGLIGNTIKILSKIMTPILRIFIKDVYGIDKKICKVESEVENLEKLEFLFDPMDYFNKVGDGYAIIFHYCAVGACTNLKTIKKMDKLGQTIGTLISLRDSVQDLKKDRKSGSFNPFITWKRKEIMQYYQNNSKTLINNINILIENISIKINIKNEPAISDESYIYNQPQALGSLVKFASIATTPFLGCKLKYNEQPVQNNLVQVCSGFDLYDLFLPLAIIMIICSCLISCCAKMCGGRRAAGATGASIPSGGSSGCGDCNCMASDCNDCGCGDCGDCGCGDCGGCDCGGCDAGGCDCSC